MSKKQPQKSNKALVLDADDPIFLSYQREWLNDPTDFKVCVKSRRIGLSWAEAADAAFYGAMKDGGDTYYIGFDKEMARGFIEDCVEWCAFYQIAMSEDTFIIKDLDKDILVYEIRFTSGNKIQALSSSPRQLRSRGKRKPHIVIDECAHINDFNGILKAAIALTIWGGKIRCISTYNGENEFSELVDDIRSGRRQGTVHEIDLNRALEDGLYTRIAMKSNLPLTHETQWKETLINKYGDDADEELFCIRSGESKIYFPRSMVLRSMESGISVYRYNQDNSFSAKDMNERNRIVSDWLFENLYSEVADKKTSLWFGMDIGRSVNLSSMVFIKDDGLTLKTVFVIELFNIPFSNQEQVLFYVLNQITVMGGCIDAGGIGLQLAETIKDHYPNIEKVQINDSWYARQMPKYRQYLEDQSIRIPHDNDILLDHRQIKKIKGIPKMAGIQKKENSGKRRHGDTVIAICLALQAFEQFEQPDYDILSDGAREYAK